MQPAAALHRQKVSHFVESDTARPVKETTLGVEILHLFPEHDTRLLKYVLRIGRINKLLGDEGVDAVSMLHELSDKQIAGVVACR